MERSSSADQAMTAALSVRFGKTVASKSVCRLRLLPVGVLRRFLAVGGVSRGLFLAADADMSTERRGFKLVGGETVVAELALKVQGPPPCRQYARLRGLHFDERCVEGL